MTTVKTFLVTASCGLVLLGAVAAPAMGLSSVRGPNGPNCVASPDVRDIPYDDEGEAPCPPPKNVAALAA